LAAAWLRIHISGALALNNPGVIPKRGAFQPREGSLATTRGSSAITASTHPPSYAPLMRKPKRFYVYIMTNVSRPHVLYTGIRGNLSRRVFEHKNRLIPGFTCRYKLTRLVYYERFAYPDAAIDREKEVKGWRREKKIRLIESQNPDWNDLAERWTDIYKPDTLGALDPSRG
jgi:putative endonuclease